MQMYKIIKRDGTIVDYNRSKIGAAILAAAQSVGGSNLDLAISLSKKVEDILFKDSNIIPSVDKVQNIVEKVLIEEGHAKTAKAYILYRNKRDRIRDANSYLMSTIRDLTLKDSSEVDLKRENANINGDATMGVMLRYGSEVSKYFAHLDLLKPEHSKAHLSGLIHIHDLDFYALTLNCVQIDLDDLFKGGFNTGYGKLREPNDIRSYSSLAAIAIQSNQNDMFGGQSIAKFDYDLAPGVAKTYVNELCKYLDYNNSTEYENIKEIKNKLKKYISDNSRILNKEGMEFTYNVLCEYMSISKDEFDTINNHVNKHVNKNTYQAMEAYIHNMNTLHSRAGSQVPFSSINYGTDTSTEGRILIKNLLYALDAGLGDGETPIFPIHVFKVKDGINGNPEDVNYDLFQLACRVSGKRLFPNFTFIDAPFNLKYYKEGHPETESATMGCIRGDSEVIVCGSYITRINDINISKSMTIRDLFNIDSVSIRRHGLSFYRDVEQCDLRILDSSSNNFVKVKKIIKNPDIGNWMRIGLRSNTTIYVTEDHPLQIAHADTTKVSRVVAKDLVITDRLITSKGDLVGISRLEYVGYMEDFSYDVETESDKFDFNGIRSHNCRTRVVANTYDPSREIFTKRGNLSFTSINLPRLAIMAESNLDKFFNSLDDTINMVFDQLLERFEVQAKKKCKNFPFLMGQGVYLDSEKLHPEDEIREVIKHGTLTLGFIGLAECLVALTGKHHGESEESQALGLKIVSFMRDKCDKKCIETGLNFSLIGTPAEGLSGRFVDLDKKKFGVIKGVTDRDYYTNSSHVPVYFPISISKKIDIEAPYHALENGGHICYVEVDGDISENPQAFESIIQYMKKSGIGYGSINHPVDRDPVCGYVGIIGDTCPRCGRHEGEGITEEQLVKCLSLHKDYRPDDEIAEQDTKLLNY